MTSAQLTDHPAEPDARNKPEPQLTEEQFTALSRCAQWQRMYGDRANWATPPLDGIALELCERGYLIPDDLGGVLVGLTVSHAGLRKVAH